MRPPLGSPPTARHPLVGMFFHTTGGEDRPERRKGRIRYQGSVEAVEQGTAVVVLYSYMDGSETREAWPMAALTERGVRLYRTAREMRDAYFEEQWAHGEIRIHQDKETARRICVDGRR